MKYWQGADGHPHNSNSYKDIGHYVYHTVRLLYEIKHYLLIISKLPGYKIYIVLIKKIYAYSVIPFLVFQLGSPAPL